MQAYKHDDESEESTVVDQDDYRYVPTKREFGATTWVNPSEDKTVRFELLTNIQTGKKGTGRALKRVQIKPKGKVTLSSEFDQAIRKENKLGQIVGGVCPWLLKDGESDIPLHPALMAHREIEKQELVELAKQLQEARDLREAREVKAELKAKKIKEIKD